MLPIININNKKRKMKKTFLSVVLLGAITVGTFYSCKKEASQPQASMNSLNVSTKKNVLVFKNISDYENVVNNPSEEKRMEFLKEVKSFKDFTSLSETPTNTNKSFLGMDTLITDEYFKEILNNDLIVQIEEYLYRVNPILEKVFVLPATGNYEDLVNENLQNLQMRVFSFNDDVLEAIKNIGGDTTSQRLFCNESGVAGQQNKTVVVGGTGYNLILDYNKYGIYFSLSARYYYPLPSCGFDFTGGSSTNKGAVYYHVKCGQTVGEYQTTSYGGTHGSYIKYQSYSGSKALNKFYFGCRIMNFSTHVSQSNYINIRANY
jgi:hypothetical protein